MRPPARTALAVLLAAVGLMLAAPVALAQDTGWTIESFHVDVIVRPDGSLGVVERIDVDFDGLQKHGIFRSIPVRYPIDDTARQQGLPEGEDADDFRRVLTVDAIRVESTAPDDIEVTEPSRFSDDAYLTIRIGDPDRTVTGRQTYTITYRVRGAMTPLAEPELYWDATGESWPVPIRTARLVVSSSDAEVTRSACFRGSFGSGRTCDEHVPRANQVTFAASDLQPGEGMTGLVAYAPGLDVPPLDFARRWSLGDAFFGEPAGIPLALFAAILGFGGVFALGMREGRDRITRGGVTVDSRLDGPVRRSALGPRTVPVRFRPPEDLRPGQLGLLVDERVDPVDISATIVDLAVRGHLRIEETEFKTVLWWNRSDWMFVRTDREEADGEKLLPYEKKLLEALFEDGDEVLLSELRGSFAADYAKVRDMIYADGTRRRWFGGGRPDRVRTRWLGIGIAATVAAVGVLVVLVLFSRFALAGVPLVLAGLALTVAHRWMPHRTARGSALLDETLGFREFIATAEADRMRFAEEENLLLRYLPYAVVFGATERWARVLEELGIRPADVGVGGWYVIHGDGAGGLARLSAGLSEFSSMTAGSLPVTPSSSGGSGFSSGGGFSGGGVGGGGGGSW